MNFKKMMFLGIALVSTAGLSYAMARTDSQILDSVETVTYDDLGTFETYRGTLANGATLGFLRVKDESQNNPIYLEADDYVRGNFGTNEARESGFNYLRKKYNEQDISYKLTQ